MRAYDRMNSMENINEGDIGRDPLSPTEQTAESQKLIGEKKRRRTNNIPIKW